MLIVFGLLPILTKKYPDVFEGADLFKLMFNHILCSDATTSRIS